MSKLQDDARWLVDQITASNAAVKALAKPQLATSSIEAGAIEEYDAEGTLVSVLGAQFDGTHGSVTVAGPVPPEPVAPSVTVGVGQVEVRASGKFVDDAVSPMDFSHFSVHVSDLEIFDPDNETQRATITGESGDVATILLEPGEWSVLIVAVSKAGKWSDPSDTVTVEVADTLTPDGVLDELINIDEKFVETAQAIADVQLGVDGKTSIHNSVDDAVPGDYAEGDRWQKWTTLAPGGDLLASWRFTTGAWVAESMDPTYLPKIDIGQGTFGQLTGGRLVAGSVTAPLLETQLVLSTDIIAGNPLGTHAKMNANGFRVLASADGGEPTEVIRMGTDTDDYFGVANSAGELVASITSGGDLSAQSGDFAGEVSIAGTALSETLDAIPKGLVAWGGRGTDARYWAGATYQPYLHIAFDTPPNRMFRISSTPIGVNSDVATDAVVNLHVTGVTTGDAQATLATPIVAQGVSAQGEFTTRRSPVTFNRIVNGGGATSVALLISYGTISAGRAKIATADGLRSVYVTVEDIGPALAQIGEYLDGTSDAATSGTGGGSTTPPPTTVTKNYTKTYLPNGRRSFVGSGATYDYNTGYMYSGLSPAGYGDLSSMAVFPSMTGDLSGATITSIEVYVYYDFWYQGSGGDAYIGLHGQTSLTSTRPSKTYAHAVAQRWPRAAGRWIKLSSSTYAGFKAGTHRGITLGGSGGGLERYGYAHDPRIRIKYTK